MNFSTFGRHVVTDAWGIYFEVLNDAEIYVIELVRGLGAIKILEN